MSFFCMMNPGSNMAASVEYVFQDATSVAQSYVSLLARHADYFRDLPLVATLSREPDPSPVVGGLSRGLSPAQRLKEVLGQKAPRFFAAFDIGWRKFCSDCEQLPKVPMNLVYFGKIMEAIHAHPGVHCFPFFYNRLPEKLGAPRLVQGEDLNRANGVLSCLLDEASFSYVRQALPERKLTFEYQGPRRGLSALDGEELFTVFPNRFIALQRRLLSDHCKHLNREVGSTEFSPEEIRAVSLCMAEQSQLIRRTIQALGFFWQDDWEATARGAGLHYQIGELEYVRAMGRPFMQRLADVLKNEMSHGLLDTMLGIGRIAGVRDERARARHEGRRIPQALAQASFRAPSKG